MKMMVIYHLKRCYQFFELSLFLHNFHEDQKKLQTECSVLYMRENNYFYVFEIF